ncbi:MAG: signal peptidase II [Acidobacteria bacterium]|nr:signal peptidase II [Acidobacteriota bacterium]
MRRLYLLIAACVAVSDQLSKWAVVEHFSLDTVITVIPGLFSLVRVENRGVAFGFLSELPPTAGLVIILVISIAALGVVCYLLWKTAPGARRASIALALVLGGAVGNLIDRITRGRVVDFLDFYVRNYHWPAFNIADSAIVIGATLLLIDLFLDRHPTPVTD